MMSVRTNLGGLKHSPARYGTIRSADPLFPLPSGSIARRAPLKGADIRQASADILKLAVAFLFILVTGLAFVASFFMCFLCRF
jgi:hypothetical protein